ncbi:hypothetical protein ACA910_011871 [Epithemia clementina (nom. ined.)]
MGRSFSSKQPQPQQQQPQPRRSSFPSMFGLLVLGLVASLFSIWQSRLVVAPTSISAANRMIITQPQLEQQQKQSHSGRSALLQRSQGDEQSQLLSQRLPPKQSQQQEQNSKKQLQAPQQDQQRPAQPASSNLRRAVQNDGITTTSLADNREKIHKNQANDNNDHDHHHHDDDKITNKELVEFIPHQQFANELDYFSATWWQSKDRFLQKFVPSRIQSVEGAVFSFVFRYKRQVRMTSDWLQFSVEHLSKAWKITGFQDERDTASYQMFVDKTLNYTWRTMSSLSSLASDAPPVPSSAQDQPETSLSSTSSHSAMPETIAMIAFMPYKSHRNDPTRGQVLTTANLAATLTSLIRVDCGRIVIVVDRADWNMAVTAPIVLATQQLLLQAAQPLSLLVPPNKYNIQQERVQLESFFQELSSSSSSNHSETGPTSNNNTAAVQTIWQTSPTYPFEFKVRHTEIALVILNCTEADDTRSGRMVMLPKASLLGLKKAFNGTDLEHSKQWLGRPTSNENNSSKFNDKWKYTYLTEPDTILQVRHQALSALSQELQKGHIVIPHRLQPIPHARDLPSIQDVTRVVPAHGNLSHVQSISSDDFQCCDQGPDAPGRINKCGTFWWQCGFDRALNRSWTGSERHYRLTPYQLLDLTEGTQIVTLAGTEHGRRCVPQPRSKHGTSCGGQPNRQ